MNKRKGIVRTLVFAGMAVLLMVLPVGAELLSDGTAEESAGIRSEAAVEAEWPGNTGILLTGGDSSGEYASEELLPEETEIFPEEEETFPEEEEVFLVEEESLETGDPAVEDVGDDGEGTDPEEGDQDTRTEEKVTVAFRALDMDTNLEISGAVFYLADSSRRRVDISDNQSILVKNETYTLTAAAKGYITGKLSFLATQDGRISISLEKNTLDTPKLQALTNRPEGALLSWKTVPRATEYRIYRKSGGSGWQKVAVVQGQKSTQYMDTSVADLYGKAFTYTVRAYKKGMLSEYDKAGKMLVRIVYAKVTSLYNSINGVQVFWDQATGAKGYYVLRRVSTEPWKAIVKINNVKTTSFYDGGVKESYGQIIQYSILPFINNYKSAYDTKGMSICRLVQPSLLKAVNASGGKLWAKWTGISGADGYQIQFSVSKGFDPKYILEFKAQNKKEESCTVEKGVEKGKTYYVRVKAFKYVNGVKTYSTYSNVLTVKF